MYSILKLLYSFLYILHVNNLYEFYQIKSNIQLLIKQTQIRELAYGCFRTVLSATWNQIFCTVQSRLSNQ